MLSVRSSLRLPVHYGSWNRVLHACVCVSKCTHFLSSLFQVLHYESAFLYYLCSLLLVFSLYWTHQVMRHLSSWKSSGIDEYDISLSGALLPVASYQLPFNRAFLSKSRRLSDRYERSNLGQPSNHNPSRDALWWVLVDCEYLWQAVLRTDRQRFASSRHLQCFLVGMLVPAAAAWFAGVLSWFTCCINCE